MVLARRGMRGGGSRLGLVSTPQVFSVPLWVPAAGKFGDASTNLPSAIDPDPTNAAVYAGTDGFAAVWTAWNGGAFAPTLGSLGSLLMFGGGHAAYAGNAVVRFDIASRLFSLIGSPSAYGEASVDGNGAFPDTRPYPNHTNMGIDWLPPAAGGAATVGSLVFIGHGQTGVTITNNVVWLCNLTTGAWTSWVLPTDVGRFPCLAYDSSRHGLWCYSATYYDDNMPAALNRRLFFLDINSQTQTECDVNSVGGLVDLNQYIPSLEYVPGRDCLVSPISGAGLPITCIDLNGYTPGTGTCSQFTITQSGSKCQSLWSYPDGSASGGNAYLNYQACERFSYCSQDGALYALDTHNGTTNASLYKLTVPANLSAGTWAWSSETLTPNAGETLALRASSIAATLDKHMYGRLRYAPGIKSFVLSDGISLKAQALRPVAFT